MGWIEDENQAWCPDCGLKHEIVRPGKTQPICDCHQTCIYHGRNKIIYHSPGEFNQMSGYFCGDCEREDYASLFAEVDKD